MVSLAKVAEELLLHLTPAAASTLAPQTARISQPSPSGRDGERRATPIERRTSNATQRRLSAASLRLPPSFEPLSGSLFGTPESPSLYVPDAVAWKTARFRKNSTVYVSELNGGAKAVALGLSKRCLDSFIVVDAPEMNSGHTQCNYWLLLLHESVFSGDVGRRLVAEVAAALRRGAPKLVLIFEPRVGAFSNILEASPRVLHEERLFDILALEWHVGFHHAVSLGLVARALGAKLVAASHKGGRHKWSFMRPIDAVREATAGLSASLSGLPAALRASMAGTIVHAEQQQPGTQPRERRSNAGWGHLLSAHGADRWWGTRAAGGDESGGARLMTSRGGLAVEVPSTRGHEFQIELGAPPATGQTAGAGPSAAG